MDTLSDVSEYLNNQETLMDDGDSSKIRMGKIEKSEEELEIETLEHKSVVVEVNKYKVVVFTKAPFRDYSKPFMRFSAPCVVDRQGAWNVELDLAYPDNYITEEMLGKLGFVRLDYGEGNADRLNMLEEDKDTDTMLASLVEGMDEIESASNELVKMGKANRNKIYHPLSPKQKEKILEALDRKYKELEEQKPIIEVLETYMVYRKNLDEVMMGRERLENKNFCKEEKDRVTEKGLSKKMCDPGNFVLPVRVNGTTQLSALAYIGASVSVLPYSLYKHLGVSDLGPYYSNLTMANNTQAKDMGEVEMFVFKLATKHT
ncbi:DNA-directed DNA polymerase [Tanacetum coccineum]